MELVNWQWVSGLYCPTFRGIWLLSLFCCTSLKRWVYIPVFIFLSLCISKLHRAYESTLHCVRRLVFLTWYYLHWQFFKASGKSLSWPCYLKSFQSGGAGLENWTWDLQQVKHKLDHFGLFSFQSWTEVVTPFSASSPEFQKTSHSLEILALLWLTRCKWADFARSTYGPHCTYCTFCFT